LQRQEEIIKTILFDIDGTILRCHGAGKRSLESALIEIFGNTGAINSVHFQGKTDPIIIYESLLPAGFSMEQIDKDMDKLKERYFHYLQENINKAEVTLLPGIMTVLRSLNANPEILVGLLTGNFLEGAKIKLSVFDLFKRFKFGVFGDDTYIRNDMPGIAKNKIKKLFNSDITFNEMIIIGDTIYDIECAKYSGAISIAVGTGWTDEAVLKSKKPDYYFKDLSDNKEVIKAMYKALNL
jgi:phosphoglycolate phosphatase